MISIYTTMDPVNIKVNKLHKQNKEGLQKSQLVINISGKSATNAVVNSLRRLSLENVPTYSFCDKSINIEVNSSVFDNDYMRNRLSLLTIPNLKVPIYYLRDEYWKNVDYADPNRSKDPDDKLLYDMYINSTNNGDDIMNVTTNEAEYYRDGTREENVFDKNYPVLLVQLKPGQSFKCQCRLVLGVGKRNCCWNASSNSFFEEVDDSFKLTVESMGQLDEVDIMVKSCAYMKERLRETKELLLKKYNTPDITNGDKLLIILDNETHTLGAVLGDALQMNKDVVYAGTSRPDLLLDQIKIKLMTAKTNPLPIVGKTIDYLIELYDNLQKQFSGLKGDTKKTKSKK